MRTTISKPHSGGQAHVSPSSRIGGNDRLFAPDKPPGQFCPQATIMGFTQEESGNRYLKYTIFTRDSSLRPLDGGRVAYIDKTTGNKMVGQIAAEVAQWVTRRLNETEYLAVRTRLLALGRRLASFIPDAIRQYRATRGQEEIQWIQIYDPPGPPGRCRCRKLEFPALPLPRSPPARPGKPHKCLTLYDIRGSVYVYRLLWQPRGRYSPPLPESTGHNWLGSSW